MATLCLFAGLSADRLAFHTPPAEAGHYNERVRNDAAAFSAQPNWRRVGTWIGSEVPLPPAAEALLDPNVAFSRSYQDAVTGRRVTFLLIQCSDARAVLGHYPPNCYPRQGWTLAAPAEPRDWAVDDLLVRGTYYEFTPTRLARSGRIWVANFMVLPDGTTDRDMAGVTRIARDPRTKYFGAAQVQLVGEDVASPSDRDELVRSFVRAYRPLIRSIMAAGVPQ